MFKHETIGGRKIMRDGCDLGAAKSGVFVDLMILIYGSVKGIRVKALM